MNAILYFQSGRKTTRELLIRAGKITNYATRRKNQNELQS